jgi:hypothetical protein
VKAFNSGTTTHFPDDGSALANWSVLSCVCRTL